MRLRFYDAPTPLARRCRDIGGERVATFSKGHRIEQQDGGVLHIHDEEGRRQATFYAHTAHRDANGLHVFSRRRAMKDAGSDHSERLHEINVANQDFWSPKENL